MIKIIFLIIFSTIICTSQNIVDSLLIQEKNDRIFTSYVYDEEESISLFNWYFKEKNPYYKYFSYINIDDNLNIKMVNDTSFQLENYSDVIIKNSVYYIADNDVVNGHTRLLYFDGNDVTVRKVLSEKIKFKHSFFHDDLMFSLVNDAIHKDPDSLHIKFYISDLNGEFVDSIIYKNLDRKDGTNFIFRHLKPYKESNNTYILGSQSGGFVQEFKTFVIKINNKNEFEFVKELQREQDSLLPIPFKIYKYFDKYLIVGIEEDRKKKLIYSFIKLLDYKFDEIDHFRFNLFNEHYFSEVIINIDSTLSIYGKKRNDKVEDKFKPFYVNLNKNFEVNNFKVFSEENEEIESGFHYAVSRENLDIVIGFEGDYLYIAKFDKAHLSVDRKIENYNVIYNEHSNTLEFNINKPENVEIIDLLGKQYYESKVNTKILNLPDLPKNQIIFAKMTFENSVYVQRIK